MEKVAQDKVAQLLKDASAALLKMAEERDAAVAELAELKRGNEVSKIAHDMLEKGVAAGRSHGELSTYLHKLASEGKLAPAKAAIDLIGPDMGEKLASLAGDDSNSGNRSAAGSSTLEQYLISGG